MTDNYMNNAPVLKKPEAMVFDMDGTLFQTETLLLPAYHKLFDTLRAEGLYEGETPPEELILNSLGMLLDEIWRRVMPEASEAAHRRADELLLQLELEGLKSGSHALYPHVKETLQSLHEKGVRLFVASNGLEDYVKGIAAAYEMVPIFEGLYSAGEYSTLSKVNLLEILLSKHDISNVWMVGDRSSDVEAGKKNGQTVIGCAYAGFGVNDELKGSDAIITDFTQLLTLYKNAE
ncbi:HAD hydrolase-like protein [Paenibacillus sp. UKAQ_18]|uniref:HAD family hydrolase n=1 Tax=Paenibacillus sp. MZ03-122A TaxID=2962033 RepID=UPI001F343BB3|nr:HAD hydrolase-like protein [Paenibacillus sp. MZ03-122A]MCF2718313.1 HAD hydrolase-like protein [Paenibacillus sp. UKAQ_18]MCP3777093.1 HAD hydrolase-like protein [Paenibacillus sp. MZ03-122A]